MLNFILYVEIHFFHFLKCYKHLLSCRNPLQGIPGGSVVKNLSANARDTALIPNPGRLQHATEQLSLGASTIESVP